MTVSHTRIYLDHNASAPLGDAAREAMIAALSLAGNPSSTHAEGRAARAVLERARREIGALAGAPAENVVFTSGASEAATTCLVPEWSAPDGASRRFRRLAVLASDHACLREGGRFDAAAVDHLPIRADGVADPGALAEWLAAWGEGGLLAFSGANNETGSMQPADRLIALAREAGAGAVVDAAQMPGRLPLDALAGADAVILSGHKMGAPKGVGAFVLGATDRRPLPLVRGGAQETRQRAGTPALALVAGFGAAAAQCPASRAHAPAMRNLRDRLEARLLAACPDLVIFAGDADRLPQTLAFAVPGQRAETLAMRFDLEGFAVSAGSACSSGKLSGSAVLEAHRRAGLAVGEEDGLVRLSFSDRTSAADLDAFAAAFERIAARPAVCAGQTRAA